MSLRRRQQAGPSERNSQPARSADSNILESVEAVSNMNIRAGKAPRGRAASCLLLLALLCCGAVMVRAQGTTPQRGFKPGGSYAITDIESVSTVNGNLMLHIPLASLPAGRGGMSAGVSLIYNSKLWDTPPMQVPDPYNPNQRITSYHVKTSKQGGWRYGFGYTLQLINKLDEQMYSAYAPNCETDAAAGTEYSTRIYKLQIIFPDGSTHELVPQGYQDSFHTYNDGYYNIRPDGYSTRCDCHHDFGWWSCVKPIEPVTTGTMTYYTTDGTYLKLQVPHNEGTGMYNKAWTMYAPDGGRVEGVGIIGTSDTSSTVGSQRIYDRNNNYVEVQHTTYNSHRADKIVDQFDRSITIEYGSAPQQDTIYANGVGGIPLVWQVNWKPNYATKTVYTDEYGTAYTAGLEGSQMVVDSIVLPAQAGGLSYSFTYNGSETNSSGYTVGCGELASVTLPSGAKAKYTYNLDNVNTVHWYEVLQNYPKTKTLEYDADYDGSSTTVSDEWNYAFNFYGHTSASTRTSVTGPDGGVTTDEIKYDTTDVFDNGSSFRTTRPDGSVVERIWRPNTPSGPAVACGSCNSYVKTEFTSLKDANGNFSKTAIRDFSYDKNGNVTRTDEYDWVPYADVPRTNPGFGITGNPTGIPTGAQLKRSVTNGYYNPTPDASNSSTADPDAYYYAGSPRIHGSIRWSETRDAAQTLSRTEYAYDDATATGNLTLLRMWDTTKGPLAGSSQDEVRLNDGNSVSSRNEYDDNTPNPSLRYGNVTLSIDANGNRTKYTYGAITRTDGVTFTGLYPTTVVAAEGAAVQRTASNVYDFWGGVVTRATDEDNQVSTSTTYDALGRPTLVEEADDEQDANGVSLERRTVMAYSDALRRVIVRSDLNHTNDGKRVSVSHYDQLGRVRLTRTLEDSSAEVAEDENSGVKVQTRYLTDRAAHANYVLTSNPYRASRSSYAGAETTMGWALTTSDQGGRVTRFETFGGATLPAPWGNSTAGTGSVNTAYDAEKMTITDQAETVRRNVMDGLGRLVQVVEAPGVVGYGFVTSYSYDALGNLTQVSQGEQNRTFAYSSLSRLTSATMPEMCRQQSAQCVPVPITFEYDGGGNLKKKTDPRLLSDGQTHLTVSYEYDALNRVTTRTYNDDTPDVTYTYDTAPGGRGLVAAVSSSASVYSYNSYDALGRVKSSSQTTGGVTYAMPDYQYNFADGITSEQYPTGRVVKTEYDAAGRLAGVKNQATELYYAGGNPAVAANPNVIKYTAHGMASSTRLGNGLWEHAAFNSRLQPTQIGLGNTAVSSTSLRLDYAYGKDDGHNDGSIRTQTITVPGMTQPFVQTYGYDELNRLKSAEESNAQVNATAPLWKQVYFYDRYGNRALTAGTSYPAQTDAVNNPAVSTANNRVTSPGYSYDDAGNLTALPLNSQAVRVLAYDADNHQKKSDGGAAVGGADYVYDGTGRRVKKISGAETTVYVYDVAGRLIAEYGGAQPQAPGTSYVTQDHLGSVRMITGQDPSDVRGRYDYLPFGEELYVGRSGYGGSNDIKQRFANNERDAETGFDYVQARYYSSAHGRFTSPDPLLASGRIENPQSWNRYPYVLGNPLKYSDPTGLFEFAGGTSKDDMARITKAYNALVAARDKYKQTSREYREINNALTALGKPGEANGVTVQVDNSINTPGRTVGGPEMSQSGDTATGNAEIIIQLKLSDFEKNDAGEASLAGAFGHEGSHAADYKAEIARLNLKGLDLVQLEAVKKAHSVMSRAISEVHAYRVSSYIAAAISPSNVTNSKFAGYEIWNRSWSAADARLKREIGIKGVLESPQGSYKFSYSGTPTAPLGLPYLFTDRTLDNQNRWTKDGGPLF